MKVNFSYSDFVGILTGVLQGYILDLLRHLFCDIDNLDMKSYADYNTPYTLSSDLDANSRRLKNYTVQIFEWSHKNRFK